MSCPSEEELFHLVDGGLLEDRSRVVRAHVATCSRCTADLDAQRQLLERVASPIEGAGQPSTAAVMARLELRAPVPSRGRWAGPLVFAGLLAAAAGAFLFSTGQEGAFQARGSSTRGAFSVEVVVKALSSVAPLQGAVVSADAPFVVSYRNLGAAPVYLMAFMLDSERTVHWLYPAYADASSDPQSVSLSPATSLTALPEAIEPAAPAPGVAMIFVLLTHEAQRVSAVEALGTRLDEATLRARFPGARVDVQSFVIAPVNR